MRETDPGDEAHRGGGDFVDFQISVLKSGSALPGGYLSFASPKERYQRKGDPGAAALRAALRYSAARAAAQLGPYGPSDSARGLPPRSLRCSARHRGPKPATVPAPDLPSVTPRSAARRGDVAEDCLSPSHCEGRVPQAPRRASIAGQSPQATVTVGCLFLWLLSFGQAKESNQLSGCPRQTCAQVPRPRWGRNNPHLCLNFGLRFSTKAAMPSFWSSVANSE
jgi:hypothetical protein